MDQVDQALNRAGEMQRAFKSGQKLNLRDLTGAVRGVEEARREEKRAAKRQKRWEQEQRERDQIEAEQLRKDQVEQDDALAKAAEELGIDLSGVKAE